MNLRALQHIIRAAQALAEEKSVLVLGSASLLASFPDLGEPAGILANTFDADLLAEPFDELTSVMLQEALGEGRGFFRIHGYHADVLREPILETLPEGWRERLVVVPETERAWAISPEDLAAVKLLVGRPKDLQLLRLLVADGKMDGDRVGRLMPLLKIRVEARPRLRGNFRQVFGE